MKQLIAFVCLLLALMSFQTQPKKQVTAKPKTTVVTTAPAAGIKAVLVRGKAVYLQQCLACHQSDGGGVAHLNAPLNGASAVVGKSCWHEENILHDPSLYSGRPLPGLFVCCARP